MKRVLSFLTLAGAVAGAVWYARQSSEPQPAPAEGEWAGRPELKAVPDPVAPAEPATVDDLTEIKGIGPKYSQQLLDLGITSFGELAGADAAALNESFDARADVEGWIAQARDRTQA
ncbi:MAG: helix-hairpin-helix domain-containing protein [Acidimicrobiia bacterium]